MKAEDQYHIDYIEEMRRPRLFCEWCKDSGHLPGPLAKRFRELRAERMRAWSESCRELEADLWAPPTRVRTINDVATEWHVNVRESRAVNSIVRAAMLIHNETPLLLKDLDDSMLTDFHLDTGDDS